jgi:hypothetical protein
LRRAIETQQSLQVGIKNFLKRDLKCPFSCRVQRWWESPRPDTNSPLQRGTDSLHQRLLFMYIQKGLAGFSIYENLVELDAQMINSCDDDIEKHISLLPLILQIPLLGMLFPAILMLLLVPALKLLQI